jgi:tetratricopeptide (TPR) repeat protein
LKSIVLHSKLNIDGREFHIHTGTILERQLIQSEIFESGKFVTSAQQTFDLRKGADLTAKEEYLKSMASELHQDTIEEINKLFTIEKKISPLRLYMPHYKLGLLFYYKDLLAEAQKNFHTVIDLKPEFIPAYIHLGKTYIKAHDYEKAFEILITAYKMNSEYADLANGVGVTLSFLQHYQKAISILQQALKKNPEFDEANFNLGVALFRSTIDETKPGEKAIVPSRVLRFIKSLKTLERYKSEEWQSSFNETLDEISKGDISSILTSLETLQLKLVTYLELDPLMESFYLKFMYGGRELTFDELDSYEKRMTRLSEQRKNFADYWNELGTIHMIQCRNLFLNSVDEFDKAVELNANYDDAITNLQLIKNVRKGFLILLRAILK